jgi:hypothetical protein
MFPVGLGEEGKTVIGKGQRLAGADRAVLGKYRLETAQEEQHKGMSVARGDQPTSQGHSSLLV